MELSSDLPRVQWLKSTHTFFKEKIHLCPHLLMLNTGHGIHFTAQPVDIRTPPSVYNHSSTFSDTPSISHLEEKNSTHSPKSDSQSQLWNTEEATKPKKPWRRSREVERLASQITGMATNKFTGQLDKISFQSINWLINYLQPFLTPCWRSVDGAGNFSLQGPWGDQPWAEVI